MRAARPTAPRRARGRGGPYRVHAYRHAGGVRVAIRLLAETVPSLEQLGLPPIVAALAQRPAGLVLFTGPTGSGKTTALAALVDRINRTSERNVVTIEDPVEYVHVPVRSLVTHCEIGRDVNDYAEALRGFLRADPDVILVGEMRDGATMAAALTAAETGHLVFATLHTNDAAQTVDRIVDAFPADAHAQVRTQLAAVLAGYRRAAPRPAPRRRGSPRGRGSAGRNGRRAGADPRRQDAPAAQHDRDRPRRGDANAGDAPFRAGRARRDRARATRARSTSRPADVRALERSAS